MSYPRSPPSHATIVQPLDAATVLSQQVSSDQANPPVTMSWSGQSFAVTGAVLENETPPDYYQACASTHPLMYTFSPYGPATLLLLPHASTPDTRPLYHISFASDVYNPTAGITAVHQGGSAQNALVGEFDWGPSKATHAVRINSTQYEASTVLQEWREFRSSGSCQGWTWKWRDEQVNQLFWRMEKFRKHVVQCYHVPGGVLSKDHILGNGTPVAFFTGRPLRTREDHHLHPLPTLKIYPGARIGKLLDHIVLTSLMIERWRLAADS